MYSFPAGSGFRATILFLERRRLTLATLENLSTQTKRSGSPRRPFVSTSHPRPDYLTCRCPLPRTFRHLPVPFERFWAAAIEFFLQLRTVSPRCKSNPSASYLLSSGPNGAGDWNGSTKRASWVWRKHPGAMIACACPGTGSLTTAYRSPGQRQAYNSRQGVKGGAFKAMLLSILAFQPHERVTAQQVLHSDWMKTGDNLLLKKAGVL